MRHAVALEHLPPDVLVRVVRRALVHHRGGAVGERPVDDVGVPGDPADVGRAPVDVLLGLEVEDDLVRVGDAGQVAAGRVEDALRLRRRARRVEDEQRVLGVEAPRPGTRRRPSRTARGTSGRGRRPSARRSRRAARRRSCSSDFRSPISSSTSCLMAAVLPLRRAPSTVISALASETSMRSLHRLDGEAAEHDVVRRADARAGEHRDDDLGDHRQEDPDDVAGLDAEVLQRVGELLDVAVEVGVRDVALLALLTAPVERHAVAVAGLHVAVDAVVGRR